MNPSHSTHTLLMLHRHNRESMATVTFEDDTLTISTKSGVTTHELNASEIKPVSLTKLPVANRLAFLTEQGQHISINGHARMESNATASFMPPSNGSPSQKHNPQQNSRAAEVKR